MNEQQKKLYDARKSLRGYVRRDNFGENPVYISKRALQRHFDQKLLEAARRATHDTGLYPRATKRRAMREALA